MRAAITTGPNDDELFEKWIQRLCRFRADRAMATDINSSEIIFGQNELNYTAQHYVHVNHDQTITASTGIAYAFGIRPSMDPIYGSGFYDGFADKDQVPEHCPVSFGIKHDFKLAKHPDDEPSPRRD